MPDRKVKRRPSPSHDRIFNPRPIFSIDRFGIVRGATDVETAILRHLNTPAELMEVRHAS